MAREKEILDYLNGMEKLTPKEFEVMRFIWNFPDGVSSDRIYEHFKQNRGTIGTVLSNITGKGYAVNQQIGRHHHYEALISRIEYDRAVLRQQMDAMVGDGSFAHFVAAFLGKEKLDEAQKSKVEQLLKELENADDE